MALCNDTRTGCVNLDLRRMSGETRINTEWEVFLQLQQSGFVVSWIMLSVSWDDLEAFCIILSPVWGIIV